jgi:protein-L-isoaspartate(D-aspartate) O-methyltransferase
MAEAMVRESKGDGFQSQRQWMVESQLRKRGIRDLRVLDAMARVPRHEFVAEQFRSEAYDDHPIPIGEGQTISQPFIVARMLEVLELSPSDVVLEIGTGSGYQTALLSELTQHTYSVERHEGLAQTAERTLARLSYNNITISIDDGSAGLAESGPFDAIVVSAAAPEIPPALVEQLREGGRMAIPVGPSHSQELLLVRKRNGNSEIMRLEACRFVPLIGTNGYASTPQ